MSAFTPEQVEEYSLSLTQQIKILADHQSQTNSHVVESNRLLTALAKLKSGLMKLTKIEWYKRYQSTFENYFFDQLLLSYTNQIKKDYIKFWQDLNVIEQMEFTKLQEVLFRIPNLGLLTTDNFGSLVSKPLLSEISHWAKIYKFELNDSQSYQPTLGVDQYDYLLTDENGDTFILSAFVYQKYIELQLDFGFQHSYLTNVIRAIFSLIDQQQKRA